MGVCPDADATPSPPGPPLEGEGELLLALLINLIFGGAPSPQGPAARNHPPDGRACKSV